ncbi:MAG: sigma-70 family RNA polymerase sigma factor [Gemmatimonadetes bacterium]|nr:sigma-70 family RNA polymerase sigma factor [Gemmatimonadota bacterium]
MSEFVAELYAQYKDALERMLYRRTGDRERAEELTQEVFSRAVAAPPRNPRPWLFAVALNLLREEGRKATRHGRRLELYRGEQPTTAPGPDDLFDRDERVAQIRQALETLTDRDREALLLQAEGFNYDEIAQTLGLARGAIGTTLARARRRLVDAYRAREGTRHVAS